MISKEVKRLYINVNPSKWKSFNYRNIHSQCYSIIGKHSSLHTGTAAFEYSIRNCHSLSDYIVITKPFHATQPFIRIEILIFQDQERQVFSSNLTISNYNFEFVPRPLFVAGAEKYIDACRHIGKNSRRWTRGTGINCFFPVYVFLKRFTLITSHLQGIDFMMQRDDFAAERPEWLSVFSFIMQRNDRNDSQNLPSETKQVSVLLGPYWFVVDH